MFKTYQKVILLILALVAFSSQEMRCDPPINFIELTPEQRVRDMESLFSHFERDYAPLDYKQKKWGFNFLELKKEYIEKAKLAKNNKELEALMQSFVAHFADAHTSLSFVPSNLKGVSEIAFLGFFGTRKGQNIVVTEILPLIDQENFPLKVGDEITKINGLSVYEYIDKNLVPYRNLGNNLSNYTFSAPNVGFRMSHKFPIPKEKGLKLLVKSMDQDGKELISNLELPWVKRDLSEFKVELKTAQSKEGSKKVARYLSITDKSSGKSMDLFALDQRKKLVDFAHWDGAGPKSGSLFTLENQLVSQLSANPAMLKKFSEEENLTAFERLAKERVIPKDAVQIQETKIFPAYMYVKEYTETKSVIGNDGKTFEKTIKKQKKIGYIRIDTFSPEKTFLTGGKLESFDDADIVNQTKAALRKFQTFGVEDIIIDTIDNPGGSLGLLVPMTQVFSSKPLDFHQMQFALNENWMGEFKQLAEQGQDPTRWKAQKIYDSLAKEARKGKTISKAYPMNSFMPDKLFAPNREITKKFNLIVLTNEGNASCGDIFPDVLKMNKVATIIGKDAMGAGGNVVSYATAQNINAVLRQTESLLVRKDGSYIENNGTKVDIEVDATLSYNGDGALKFEEVISNAEEVITNKACLANAKVKQISNK